MTTIITNLDWPNLIAGAVLAVFSGIIISLARGLYGYYIIARDLPYPIWGTWFSAEFDQKGTSLGGKHNIERRGRNTFLAIEIKRRLGRKVLIKAMGPIDNAPQEIPTKWVVEGRIVKGDTVVGIWRSTIKHTSRHGTAIIKFLDHGRALGYWTGSGEAGYPMYGYWIISRNKEDAIHIASNLLSVSEFKTLDLASYAVQYLSGTDQSKSEKIKIRFNE
jgi:hypothetical protein